MTSKNTSNMHAIVGDTVKHSPKCVLDLNFEAQTARLGVSFEMPGTGNKWFGHTFHRPTFNPPAPMPPLYANDGMGLAAPVHFIVVSLVNGWWWAASEVNIEDGTCFGVVCGHECELGYFNFWDFAEYLAAGTALLFDVSAYAEPERAGLAIPAEWLRGQLTLGDITHETCAVRIDGKTTLLNSEGVAG